VLHVPLTYRDAPLAQADQFFVGTTEHSVLGTRWVYDGCGDPAWVAALATTVLTGGTQIEEFVDVDGRFESREATASVLGSGTAGIPVAEIEAMSCHDEGPTTVIRADALELVVVRVYGGEVSAAQTLTGSVPVAGRRYWPACDRSSRPDAVNNRAVTSAWSGGMDRVESGDVMMVP
jgi:hypothetical protein